MVARNTKTTKKVKPTFSRRKNTGFAAAPEGNFRDFNDYIRTDVDKKDVASKIKSYIKVHMSKAQAKIALEAPEWAFTGLPFVAATIAWKEMGKEFPVWWKAEDCLNRHMKEILDRGHINVARKLGQADDDAPQRKTIQEILKEKTSDFIASIDGVVDLYDPKNHKACMEYSLYDEMKKVDAANNTAKAIFQYYTPIRDEVKELVEEKPEDLVEAYSYLFSVPERKKYLEFLNQIVNDADKYMASKKALRATRKPKVKTADKQVEKLNFAKDSKEYKLTSITPTSVIGAMRLFTFNVKYRELTEYVCEKAIGFEVRGSTLLGIDADLSRSTRLRKPDEFIKHTLTKSVNQINKEWSALTTKTSKNVNGRINKDTILIRAMAK
jgi:hypothetical protein